MPTIGVKIVREGPHEPQEPAFPDLAQDLDNVVHVSGETPWRVAVLNGGMSSGLPSIALVIPLPDGRTVLAETSLANWSAVTVAARAAFPEAFHGGPLD